MSSVCVVRSTRVAVLLSMILGWQLSREATAAPHTWIGGNVNWNETAGADPNWNPNSEPDIADEAIFNTANTVNLGTNNSIQALTMSGGIDLLTNDLDLSVDGLVQLTGASTNLIVGGAAGSINADNVTINSGGNVELRGGLLTLDEEVGTSLLSINAGGTLSGNGTLTFADTPVLATTLLVNDGTLTALSRSPTILDPPPVGTLQINDVSIGGRVNLDGLGEAGIVNVNRNQTLDLNTPQSDAFSGTMNLFHQSTFDSSSAWTLDTGTINVNNGFVDNPIPNPDIPAGVAFIKGGTLTQTGGTINVADTDGTLQIDAPYTMSGGSFTNSGTVIFNGVTSITTAAGYAPSSISAQTVVNANVTINDGAGNFNWDGNGGADTTVNGPAQLSITANQIDTTDNVFGGTLTLNDDADLQVNVTGANWTLGGILNVNGTGVGSSSITGDGIIITGTINHNTGSLVMPAGTQLNSTAVVHVNGTLTLGNSAIFAGPSVLDGIGALATTASSSVTANTTVNVNTFLWDGGVTGGTQTVSDGVVLTINSNSIGADGDVDDIVALGGSGAQLIVNGPLTWTQAGVFNANTATAGTATIGGTSRMIVANVINVDGNTTLSAPVTFNRAGLVADIDAGMTLDVTSSSTTYADGTIDGAGTFDPGISNTVTGDFAINADRFDFDGGSWTVESGAALTFNSAVDYEPDSVTNSFESTITLNNGGIFANVADPTVVMNGTLNMNASGGFNAAEWNGDAIDIGNDAGILDANLNVTGDGNPNSQARFFAPVTFMSDADVDVPAGASLVFNRAVTFNSVNAANNAEFTGAGTMTFSDDITVSETTTLNMVGGTVDLDGNDAVGDSVNIDAPLTINAATLNSFGRVNGGGGVNTLNVNSNAGTGALTVNLDDPAAKWTINGPGVLNLVNDFTPATLLAGNDVNIDGTLNVTGDVRTTARLDLGPTSSLNVFSANEPLRLAGGDNGANPNTIRGGQIGGIGLLGADTGKALHGAGTINVGIDFDGTANLKASNGTLTINGALIDVNILGTADENGVLNVINPWNTLTGNGGSIGAVVLAGGTLQGGTITNDNSNGIQGLGLVTSKVINNTKLLAVNGLAADKLIFQTAANDNDWDGAANIGLLQANVVTLELRDNATFGFTGTVQAAVGGRVFTNGFALDFNPGSSLNLTNGTYESTSSTDIGGTVTIGAGIESKLKVTNNFFLTFEPASTTTLNGNLRLQNNNINIEAGATFSGAGALIVDVPSHLVADNLANINVLLINEGTFRPGGINTVGRVDVKDYQQSATGTLVSELAGVALNQFDRLIVGGNAVLSGTLDVDLEGGFLPALGNSFPILSATAGVIGRFSGYELPSLGATNSLAVLYNPNNVTLQVIAGLWGDYNHNGSVDAADYVVWRKTLGTAVAALSGADGSGNGIVDQADFDVWRSRFGAALGPGVGSSVAVPEPAGALLLLLGMVAFPRILRG